jgi:hypothetical protein
VQQTLTSLQQARKRSQAEIAERIGGLQARRQQLQLIRDRAEDVLQAIDLKRLNKTEGEERTTANSGDDPYAEWADV